MSLFAKRRLMDKAPVAGMVVGEEERRVQQEGEAGTCYKEGND